MEAVMLRRKVRHLQKGRQSKNAVPCRALPIVRAQRSQPFDCLDTFMGEALRSVETIIIT
jgi:hypothetical protein